MIKIWVDAIIDAPPGWTRIYSTTGAINLIKLYGQNLIECISLNHNPHQYYYQGGDYINILFWIEKNYGKNWTIPIHLHTTNPVEICNMRNIIKHNHWREVR